MGHVYFLLFLSTISIICFIYCVFNSSLGFQIELSKAERKARNWDLGFAMHMNNKAMFYILILYGAGRFVTRSRLWPLHLCMLLLHDF